MRGEGQGLPSTAGVFGNWHEVANEPFEGLWDLRKKLCGGSRAKNKFGNTHAGDFLLIVC